MQAIPTLMVLRDGVLLAAQPGALPAAALDNLVAKVRALDMDEVRKSMKPRGRRARPRAGKAPDVPAGGLLEVRTVDFRRLRRARGARPRRRAASRALPL